jgi:GNAT superfamily N-acetyltransferase
MIYSVATAEDIEAISFLWKKMINEMQPELTPNRERWAEMTLSLINTGIYIIVIAKEKTSNSIVGFIDGLTFHAPETDKIHGIGQHFYILPEFRKTWVAALLYIRIVSIAVERGAIALDLHCGPKELKFWNRHGFDTARYLMRRM